jgi:hypothetical protein
MAIQRRCPLHFPVPADSTLTAIKWSIIFAQKMLYDSDCTKDVILSEGREALETLAALLTGKREEARMSARIPMGQGHPGIT